MRVSRVTAVVFASSVAMAVIALSPACGPAACTPEEYGLGDAERLALRKLPGRSGIAGACAAPRLVVIASDVELRKLYGDLALAPADYPSVDFARERVIVREGDPKSIAWAVSQGGTAVVGLLSCGQKPGSICNVDVVVVPAVVTGVESRTCESVGCGNPQAAPAKTL